MDSATMGVWWGMFALIWPEVPPAELRGNNLS